MATMRVKAEVNAAVYDHDRQTFVTLTPGLEFDSSSNIVKKFGWAFQNDAENDGRKARRTGVEQATAAPGERRE